MECNQDWAQDLLKSMRLEDLGTLNILTSPWTWGFSDKPCI